MCQTGRESASPFDAKSFTRRERLRLQHVVHGREVHQEARKTMKVDKHECPTDVIKPLERTAFNLPASAINDAIAIWQKRCELMLKAKGGLFVEGGPNVVLCKTIATFSYKLGASVKLRKTLTALVVGPHRKRRAL